MVIFTGSIYVYLHSHICMFIYVYLYIYMHISYFILIGIFSNNAHNSNIPVYYKTSHTPTQCLFQYTSLSGFITHNTSLNTPVRVSKTNRLTTEVLLYSYVREVTEVPKKPRGPSKAKGPSEAGRLSAGVEGMAELEAEAQRARRGRSPSESSSSSSRYIYTYMCVCMYVCIYVYLPRQDRVGQGRVESRSSSPRYIYIYLHVFVCAYM